MQPCKTFCENFQSKVPVHFDNTMEGDIFVNIKRFFLHCRTIKPVQGGILHPPKVHVSKNANMKYDRPLLKDCITTFVLFSNVFHLSGEILNLKNNFIRKNKFPTTHFLIR